jgi:hypothetical protein
MAKVVLLVVFDTAPKPELRGVPTAQCAQMLRERGRELHRLSSDDSRPVLLLLTKSPLVDAEQSEHVQVPQ